VTENTMIRGAAAVALCVTAGFATVVSYPGTCALGRDHGLDTVAARMLPLTPDALIVAASLVLVHEARNGPAAPKLARVMLWLGITAMAGADIASGARYGLPGAVIAAWPAVACAGAAETAAEFVRRCRAPRLELRKVQERVVVPDEVRDAVRAAYEASVQAGAPLAQRAMAVRFGLSCRKIRQLVPECTTYIENRRRGGEPA
jgi:hypothetical protein